MKCPRCGTDNVDYAVFCGKCGAKLGKVTTSQIPVPPKSTSSLPATPVTSAPPGAVQPVVYYAGFWKRFLAAVIDVLLIEIIVVVIHLITGGKAETGFTPNSHFLFGLMITNVLFWVFFWLYNTIMESSSKQATLGKMLIGIIVTDLDGNRLSFGKANARYWSKLLSVLTLYIGFIMAGFTGKKQGLHDILAGTLVVNKREQPTSIVTIALGVAVVVIAFIIFGRLVEKGIPKNTQNPQNVSSQNISRLTSTLKTMTVTMGMVEIKAALDRYARTNGGTYPETLSDQNFVSILPHGQMPPSPYKSGTFLSVAEEKAVDDPVDYASQNSGCNGAATEGEIDYYYSPDTNPNSWAINGCDSEGVIKTPDGSAVFVVHK